MCACVYVPTTVLKDLVMIPVHTKPEDSEKELDELYDVFQHVKEKWRTDVRAGHHQDTDSTENTINLIHTESQTPVPGLQGTTDLTART